MKRMSYLTFLVVVSLFTISCKNEPKTTLLPPEPTPEVVKKDTIKPATQILGIDVSHFQGDVNWKEVRDAKITFVYDKATEGDTFQDPNYTKNKEGAHHSNLAHGSYHFYTSDDDPIDQAEFFMSIIDYGIGDMPPVLDLEKGGIKGKVDPKKFQSDILKWLNHVESKLGVKPLIYTNHTFGDAYLTSKEFSKYQLWIAEYGVTTPIIPKTWSDNGWLIWQRSERGAVEGAIGKVDHDLYNPSKPFEVVKK